MVNNALLRRREFSMPILLPMRGMKESTLVSIENQWQLARIQHILPQQQQTNEGRRGRPFPLTGNSFPIELGIEGLADSSSEALSMGKHLLGEEVAEFTGAISCSACWKQFPPLALLNATRKKLPPAETAFWDESCHLMGARVFIIDQIGSD